MEPSDKNGRRGPGKRARQNIKKDKPWLLTEVAIPSDMNVINKETLKENKYKNMGTDRQRMW